MDNERKMHCFSPICKGNVLLPAKVYDYVRQQARRTLATGGTSWGKRRGRVCLLLFPGAENDGCGPDGEQRPVVNHPAFAVSQNFIVYECAGIARPVPQHIFDVSVLVTAGADDAMGVVDARVVGHDGTPDARSFHKPAYRIVAHEYGDNLFIMKHILYDMEIAARFPSAVSAFLLRLSGLCVSCPPYRKFLAAVRTRES